MKTRVLAGAAAMFALAGGQAFAAAGYVGAAYLDAETDVGGFEADDDGWGLEGAAAFEVSPAMGAQVGVAFADSDEGDDAFSADGHLNLRNEQRLIGGFIAAGEAADETFWAIGGEGELYMSQLTLAGAIGYASFEDDVDSWALDGEARFFLSDNFKIEGKAGYANIDSDFGDDDLTTLGIGAEYQFGAAPLSILASYQHGEFDEADLSTDAFTIGARWNFGAGSLKDQDRTGASLPGLSSFTSSLGV